MGALDYMEKLIFTNSNGVSLDIGNQAPYILKSIKGLDGLEVEVQAKKAPFQRGKSFIGVNVNERLISLNIAILSSSEVEKFTLREEISRVFNPFLGEGALKYVYGNQEKEIKVTVSAAPVFSSDIEDTGEILDAMLHLYAADPFLMDVFETSKVMAAWIGGLKFPLKLPMTFSRQGSTITINNDGDVETPVYIEFFGPATNPKIENITTGEYIRIKKDLLEGQTLVLNTDFNNKAVTIEGINSFHYIDLNSVFWQLIPGKNIIKYSADAGQEQARVKISYKNKYVGV